MDALTQFDDCLPIDEALRLLSESQFRGELRDWLSETASKGNHPSGAVEPALGMIRSRYREPLSQAQIAEELGLSQAYFSCLFKKRTGTNFVAALRDTRLGHAAELLAAGERNRR